MAYDNPAEGCKFAPICCDSIRCGAKNKKDMVCYRKDNRTLLQKIFQRRNYIDNLITEKREIDLENNRYLEWKKLLERF